ncbi:uncharacterized protein LOC129759108 [Uranotaenia lowii]|uniref:uncharacterized protein LOC129759108 n=1 Tax=Uranotaenia lowii TaxID=190385 RepID=UPI00247A1778|nr:uncharacterized protein LOC129759108 [Uranotaenia lowii]
MTKCCIKSRKISQVDAKKQNSAVSFHQQPKEPAVRKKWLAFCGRKDGSDIYVCSQHFELTEFVIVYMENARRVLIKSALPSVRCPPTESARSIRAKLRNRRQVVEEFLQRNANLGIS